MKKLLLSLLVALCAVCAIFGFAACSENDNNTTPGGDPTESYNITVTCGSGGSYELSPTGGIYSAGTVVTLTLKPNAGYAVETFTVNNTDKKAELSQDNKYEFTVTANTNIVVRYYLPEDETALDVVVTCGTGGSYTLSPDAPYHAGDTVTLTALPENGYCVETVKVDGQDVTAQLVNNAYSIAVNDDVTVEITFKPNLFGEEYIGTWDSVVTAGTLPNEIVIGANSLTFNGNACNAVKTDGGYSFSVVEGDQTVQYTISLQQAGGGKSLLVLSFTLSGAKNTQYCTKEGVDYSVSFPEELWGDWYAGTNASSLYIGPEQIILADNEGVILSYDEESKTYLFLAGGSEYTLVWDDTADTLTLTIVGNSSSAKVYEKIQGVSERLFTEFAGYRYTNGAHTVIIEENGAFNFDGKVYKVFPVDSDNPKGACNFTMSSGLLQLFITAVDAHVYNYTTFDVTLKRVTGEEAYTIDVTCGDNGNYSLSDPAAGETYGAYEEVTLTIIPDGGYKLHLLKVNNADVTASVDGNSYSFYISRNTQIEIEFVSEATVEDLFPSTIAGYTFTGTSDQGQTVKAVFEANKVTITIGTQNFVLERGDITVTDATPSSFTFKATLGTYGEVTFEYIKSHIYGSTADHSTLGFDIKKQT